MALIYAVARRCFGERAALWALALALFQPTQIWFSQEVRMYAQGALALMLTLWAVTPWLLSYQKQEKLARLPLLTLLLYPLAALFGLYTLYYFLFWLVILNLCVIVTSWANWRVLRAWLFLQLAVLIGWLPWLPTFLHQALTPPVPPWRQPWQSFAELLSSSTEALAATWFAHITPLLLNWPWALLTLLAAIAFFIYAKALSGRVRLLWLILCFCPILLLLIVTLVGPPIYHLRYVSTYAPLVIFPLAALLASIPRPLKVVTFAFITLITAASLRDFWTKPIYAADDHRNAVAALARQWRPGDAILVNAGWVYTALSVYWPTELSSPDATRPPNIADYFRLGDSQDDSPSQPVVVRSGSVDGSPNLGWGLPESDFFALSRQDTIEALAQLAATHTRIWHYRLYDTVSDPQGIIRDWLTQNTRQEISRPIPGRDFLRVERYHTKSPAPTAPQSEPSIIFPKAQVSLASINFSPTVPAGETAYVNLTWEIPGATALDAPPALSLRLYDQQGNFILQNDVPVSLQANISNTQSLALPIPADTIPGEYQVELIVYSPSDGAPFAAAAADNSALPSPLVLGALKVQLPLEIPHTSTPIAGFDYIDLLATELSQTPHQAGSSIDTSWTWRPNPSPYSDRYLAHLRLADGKSSSVPFADFTLGGDSFPSTSWTPHYPLRQRLTLTLPASVQPGTYQVLLSITRASDGKAIPAQRPWRPWSEESVTVGAITIADGQ
jgi:hypothetical protein